MTLDEFLNSPDERYSEWVDGKVTFLSVNKPHQDLCIFLTTILTTYTQARGLGSISGEPYTMRLAARPSGRQPDVMFVAAEHLDRLKYRYLDGPADLVVEVISEDSRTRDRRDKFFEYAQAGVREYWMVDYERERAEFYRLADDGTYEPIPMVDGVVHSVVIAGLWIRTAWLFQQPLPLVIDILKEWQLV